jgi:hypothetical protein
MRLTTPSEKLFVGPGAWKWVRIPSPTVTSVVTSDPHRRSTSLRQALRRPHGRLSAIGHADLAQDGFDMDLHRGLCHFQSARDGLVGRSLP